MSETYDSSGLHRAGRRQRLAILGVLALMLAAVGAPVGLHRLTASAPAPAPPATAPAPQAASAPPVDGLRGVVLAMHSGEADEPWESRIEQVAAAGADAVVFSLPAWQDGPQASSLFIEYRRIPLEGRIESLIRLAREKGLKAVVMPVLLLRHGTDEASAGGIAPADEADWWEDYTNFITFCANLANRAGADALSLGAHLRSREPQVDRWRDLIAEARRRFGGQLCYVAEPGGRQRWWGRLDLLGLQVPGRPGDLSQLPHAAVEEAADLRETFGIPVIYVLPALAASPEPAAPGEAPDAHE